MNWAAVKSWNEKPFSSDMSALQWTLFLGFAIVVSIGWKVILAYILEEI